MKKIPIRLTINNKPYSLKAAPETTLLDIIRQEAGLTGAKRSCGMGECGACTVIMDEVAVNSCCVLAVQADGSSIFTIESLETAGELHPIQEAFVEEGAVQCGFCTPGMIMSAKALLDRNPQPEEHQIYDALSGNICRCTGYKKIVNAVRSAANKMQHV